MWTWVNHIPSIFRVIYLSYGPSNAPHKMYNVRAMLRGSLLWSPAVLGQVTLHQGRIWLQSSSTVRGACLSPTPVAAKLQWSPEEKGGRSH